MVRSDRKPSSLFVVVVLLIGAPTYLFSSADLLTRRRRGCCIAIHVWGQRGRAGGRGGRRIQDSVRGGAQCSNRARKKSHVSRRARQRPLERQRLSSAYRIHSRPATAEALDVAYRIRAILLRSGRRGREHPDPGCSSSSCCKRSSGDTLFFRSQNPSQPLFSICNLQSIQRLSLLHREAAPEGAAAPADPSSPTSARDRDQREFPLDLPSPGPVSAPASTQR